MPKKKLKQEFTSPEEGLKLLELAEDSYDGFDNIPAVDFDIKANPKRFKTKLKSIRLSEYVLEGFDELAKNCNMKPQTLIKTVLEEYLNRNYAVKQQ